MSAATMPTVLAPTRLRAWISLLKLRLNVLVIVAALAGYLLALPVPRNIDVIALLALSVGVLLSAGGASAINMALEAHLDALMERTRGRPVPAGHISKDEAITFGSVCTALGVGVLFFALGPVPAALSAATVLLYVGAYTPLKTRSNLNTIVGAIPGALPVLLGWAAAGAPFSAAALSLFTLIFVWQFPHFLAIATLHREDYARAGFKMLPVDDPQGLRTAHRVLLHALLFVPVSILPACLGLGGAVALWGCLACAIFFLGAALCSVLTRSLDSWKFLFWASLLVLPVQFAFLLADAMTAS